MRACWFVRTVIANRIDSDVTFPEWTRRHLERCADCRASYEMESRLIERLVADVPHPAAESPPFLKARIMAAVNREERAPGPPVFRPAWVLSAAMALVLITFGSLQFISNFNSQSVANNQIGQNLAQSGGPLAPVLAYANREKLLQLSRNLDQPLEAEIHLVMSDAKSAMQTLAHNFLPNQMIAQVQR